MRHKKTPTNQKEVRQITAPHGGRIEIRKNADGTRSINGQAVVYNTLSQDLGGFTEKIAPGAFTRSLKSNPDVLCLYDHSSANILGRVSSGTLVINDGPKSLGFRCKLPNTSTANDLTALMDRGDLSAMSFGFSVVPGGDTWEQVGDSVIRTVNEAILYEVSVVGQPAYLSSSVSLRSCPASLRKKLKVDDLESLILDDDDQDDSDDTEDDEEDRCACECEECVAGDCANCSDPDCDEDGCSDCPMQDEAEQNRAAHRDLLLRRLR